jgi:hypothetical protein
VAQASRLCRSTGWTTYFLKIPLQIDIPVGANLVFAPGVRPEDQVEYKIRPYGHRHKKSLAKIDRIFY